MEESQKDGSAAHELFHGYQSENGEKGASVNLEVGAYLFEEGIKFSLGFGSGGMGQYGIAEGDAYDKAMSTLIFGGKYNQTEYNSALNNFLKGSNANSSNLYKNDKVIENDNNPIIKKFFPLIK